MPLCLGRSWPPEFLKLVYMMVPRWPLLADAKTGLTLPFSPYAAPSGRTTRSLPRIGQVGSRVLSQDRLGFIDFLGWNAMRQMSALIGGFRILMLLSLALMAPILQRLMAAGQAVL